MPTENPAPTPTPNEEAAPDYSAIPNPIPTVTYADNHMREQKILTETIITPYLATAPDGQSVEEAPEPNKITLNRKVKKELPNARA
jgi:hypothetical protein